MKKAMVNYMQQEKNDELYTPTEAIIPILKYLDKEKNIGNVPILEKVI